MNSAQMPADPDGGKCVLYVSPVPFKGILANTNFDFS